MAQRQLLAVHGYVRLHYHGQFITEIIDIIHEYYLIKIDSNILNSNEQISLINLLFDQLKKQKLDENIKGIDTKLLYRASEHKYNCKTFHELCDGKGATITIIHNEYDHIFGGYTNKSWPAKYGSVPDPDAFLFMIRPSVELFECRKTYKNSGMIYGGSSQGPVFGEGWDIYLWYGEATQTHGGGGIPKSFAYKSSKLFGGPHMKESMNSHFEVLDYEVFSVTIVS